MFRRSLIVTFIILSVLTYNRANAEVVQFGGIATHILGLEIDGFGVYDVAFWFGQPIDVFPGDNYIADPCSFDFANLSEAGQAAIATSTALNDYVVEEIVMVSEEVGLEHMNNIFAVP